MGNSLANQVQNRNRLSLGQSREEFAQYRHVQQVICEEEVLVFGIQETLGNTGKRSGLVWPFALRGAIIRVSDTN